MHKKRGCKSPLSRVSPISDNPDEQRRPFRRFGREVRPLLSDDEWTKICREYTFHARCKGMATLIQEIWFNPYTPENHNVRLRNIKSKYMEIWDGEKWILELKKWVMKEIMDKTADFIYEYTKSNDYYLRAHDVYTERFKQEHFDWCNDVIACVHDGTNPEKYRYVRSRMCVMVYNYSKTNWMWAKPVEFDRSAILKCHAANIVAKKTARREAGDTVDFETVPFLIKARQLTEDEIGRRVKAALLKHGLTEESAETESKNATEEFQAEIHKHVWGDKPRDYEPPPKCRSKSFYMLQLEEDRPERYKREDNYK